MSIAPAAGPPNTRVTLSVSGFRVGESVRVKYKTGLSAPQPASVVLCTITATAGTATCNPSIPHAASAGALGSHKIVAKGLASHRKAATTFTLLGQTSCLAILNAGDSTGDGVYSLQQVGGQPYQAYCDMTTNGGGWTAVFAGHNGSVNVFDHFDAGAYTGTTTDPASRYLQHAPSIASAADLAVSCGPAMVKFALTEPGRGWMTSGTQSAWTQLSPTVISGSVASVPNWLWTGSGSDYSFIFAKDQGGGGNTFASSYNGSANFDDCNGVFDQTSLVRVFYRELAEPPVRNTPATAGTSCLAILRAGDSAGGGIYWLTQSGPPYEAYCDMTTDGGGWTAVFAGRNGLVNVFDHFDAGAYTGTTSDPASRYLQRAPTLASAADLAVSCGPAMVKFALTEPERAWMTSGTQSGWTALTPTVISGTVLSPPNWLWTGSGSTSFIFAKDQGGGGNTFASSYNGSANFDDCNGVFDQTSLVRVFYRELAEPPVRNTPATAGTSCLAILQAGGTGDGIYWLKQGGSPYQAYCDMTTDGGGWTAVFAGRNGLVNVFDHFDAGAYTGTTSDPASRYLQRAPTLASAADLAVTCGSAMVKFALTDTVRGWMTSGTQSGWTALTPIVISGTIPSPPNWLWTGSGSSTSFIFAKDQGGGGNTFASSFNGSASYDDCNGVVDQASLVRVFYR